MNRKQNRTFKKLQAELTWFKWKQALLEDRETDLDEYEILVEKETKEYIEYTREE